MRDKECTDFSKKAQYNNIFFNVKIVEDIVCIVKSTALKNKHILAGYLYRTFGTSAFYRLFRWGIQRARQAVLKIY